MTQSRKTTDIKESLEHRRAELESQLQELSRRHPRGAARLNRWSSLPGDFPAISLLAGGAIGLLFIRKPLWPLRAAGRLIGLAAPIVLPLVAKRLSRSAG